MELEHSIKVLPIDGNLQSEVESLHKQGWQMAQGVVPVAVYHLVRAKNQPTTGNEVGGMGKMLIAESGVFIIPAKSQQN